MNENEETKIEDAKTPSIKHEGNILIINDIVFINMTNVKTVRLDTANQNVIIDGVKGTSYLK